MYQELNAFREARGLQNSPGNVSANTTREVAEAMVEIANKNIMGMIDEFCDLVIFPLNAIEACGHDAKSNIESIKNYDSELLDDPSPDRAVSCILISLASYSLNKDIKALSLIAKIALNAINALGYHAELCVLEKAKTINSRKGSHNVIEGKWCKDPEQCPTTLYKPDYMSCKK